MTQRQEMEREWRATNRRKAFGAAIFSALVIIASIGGGVSLGGCMTPHSVKALQKPSNQEPPEDLSFLPPQPKSLVLVVPGGGG